MKETLLKSLEKVRQSESDPIICMHLLKIYEQMAKVLGPDEIGLKILPGMIPMLVSGTFSRSQFSDLIGSVRRLLDQIEQYRVKDLREDSFGGTKGDIEGLENMLGAGNAKPKEEGGSQTKDVFEFLNSLEGGNGQGSKESKIGNAGSNIDPFSGMS